MLNPASEPLTERLLPALRAAVAQRLTDRGYTQEEVAELMGLTQPAVSQYCSMKRGRAYTVVNEDGFLREQIDALTDAVAQQDRTRVRSVYCAACEYVHREDPGGIMGDTETFFDLQSSE